MTESIIVALALGVLLAVREWQWRRRVAQLESVLSDCWTPWIPIELPEHFQPLSVDGIEDLYKTSEPEPTDVHGEDAPDPRYPN